MFFSTYVLTKKGPLAKVWLAAHWDKRLTRNEVKIVDLSQTILHIVRPVVPIALRTSGELLVGVVRIYALKVKHLLKEATEATLFLRVTTLATKGSRAALSGQQRTTSIDGVLVPQTGDMEAVTFDWDAEVAAKHGAARDAADALGEGRFDAIADLLGSGKRIEGPDGGEKDDGLLASAWYTVQPTSQAAEELHNTQQDYDEIAKMRADLMAFGERASGSASTSKSKSSLASMEKGRGSVAVDANGLPYPAMGDELDIGVPLPDELPIGFPAMDGGAMAGALPMDPFLLPDTMTADEEAPARLSRAARKPRVVNVLDLNSTTLSREAFEKCMVDRSDIVNSEPRRGPYDAQEEADRYTIGGAPNPTDPAAVAATGAAPLSIVMGETLRLAYTAALLQSVAEAAAEAARASQTAPPPLRNEEEGGLRALDDDFAHDAGAAVDEAGLQPSQRKRGRDDNVEETTGLSASVRQTLGRLRTELSSRAAADSRKKTRVKVPVSSLVGASCTVQDICRHLRRRDAARTFVDVLALASKQYVSAHQRTELGEVTVQLNETAVSFLATA
ncbi:putative double-strand-break repair protein rad21 [Leptomonas pyrrhocoris]|uniref:Putative double-strand-break repair protein rad21 n=1 Tax=Leptomonas pyrrhocoris TaxID=157538 RepID=A0A0N0DQR2_LEPPY|nr:putative double-strand-break repair protein rad21 [Leptomonas pyrrhocoris]KPA73384.1 putative double-strand-break repair protein rad21 [Leptomonas pyrrhocoris]|eukprot:XP_015651823.1 putative double-strand-break repair protein rad21 [Leptomonas pyrrhocoris]